MANILYDLLDNRVIVYLDDILIYTDNVDKQIPLVQEVLFFFFFFFYNHMTQQSPSGMAGEPE